MGTFLQLLATIEPGLGRRDQQLFELGATLIPIFFLAGTIVGAAQTVRPGARPTHLWVAFLLLAFIGVEILAELIAIRALVSGAADNVDRYLLLGALTVGMWVAGFGLLWPWVQGFYVGRELQLSTFGIAFKVGAVGIVLTILVWVGTSGYGVFQVFHNVFDVTQEERAVQQQLNEEARALRLNVPFARLCTIAQTRRLHLDEQLELRLVENELREFEGTHRLDEVLRPQAERALKRLRRVC